MRDSFAKVKAIGAERSAPRVWLMSAAVTYVLDMAFLRHRVTGKAGESSRLQAKVFIDRFGGLCIFVVLSLMFDAVAWPLVLSALNAPDAVLYES